MIGRVFVVAAAVLVLTLGTQPSGAGAHEQHQVGRYTVELGWHVEPALEGVGNAVYLEVHETAADRPVDGLAKTLRVQVTFGGGTQAFEPALRALTDTPGAYVGEIIPTRAGDYRFHLTGTIEDLNVDERFESGPTRFDPVTTPFSLQFPDQVGSSAGAARDVRALRDSVDQARLIGIAGVLVGIAGVALALTARRR